MKNIKDFETHFKIVLSKVVPGDTFSQLTWGAIKE